MRPAMTFCLSLAVALSAQAIAEEKESAPREIPLEAEHMRVVSGWVVEGGAHFDGQPNLWSGARLTADAADAPAVAVKHIRVPTAGKHLLWVRYESCYGFGSVFSVEVEQRGRRQAAVFGQKRAVKYFPFGRGWTVQGPWYWHSTDYVYQCATFELKAGKAVLRLLKGKNEQPAARRVVDFLLLTTDLSRDPGDDWSWRGSRAPRILSKFMLPLYLKLECLTGPDASLPTLQPRLWLIGYYRGPMDSYYLCRSGLMRAERNKPKPAQDLWLKPGEATGWMKVEVPKTMPALLEFSQSGEAKFRISVAHTPEGKRDCQTVEWTGKHIQVICSVGHPRYERDLLEGRKVTTMAELLERKKREVESYQVPGRKARRIFLRTAIPSREGFIPLAAAMGINAQSYGISPLIYGPEAPDMGFNTSRGFTSVQNWFLNRSCFEGDFSKLEARLAKMREDYVKQGLGEVPVTFKLIEEAGPPSLSALRTWPKINEQFRAYLKQEGVRPLDLLPREGLVQLALRPGPEADADLWQQVTLGTGCYAESFSNPALYYHSHRFRALLMAQTAAHATKLLERIWGKGTYADSGSFYPSTGSGPVLARGVEPFTLFRERGATWYSSEISWGKGGTPDFVGAEVASYEAALARALAKYHNCPRGTYVIADPNRGYTGDFVERYSYGLTAQRLDDIQYYTLAYPAECTFVASSDIHKAIKRVSYTLGPIEDRLLNSDVVPAKTALGWSFTTDIWDLAVPPRDPREVSNNVYPQERLLLYLLLRHAQLPVDILCEQDLTAGRLHDYKIFFLVGDHLRAEAAKALRDWVEAGGTLIAVAGGGLRDEYNRPSATLYEVFGLKDANLQKRQYCLRPKLELLHTPPLDRIHYAIGADQGRMDVYGFRQSIEPEPGAEVLGRFDDGKPAVLRNHFGKGRAVLIGGLPGLAYVKPAIPLLPFGRGGKDELSTFTPTAYDASVRRFITRLADTPDVAPPVVTSHPLVEATLLRAKDGRSYYVALVNYDTTPIEGLTISVHLPDKWEPAERQRAHLRDTPEGKQILLEDPLEKFAFLELRPRR